ncbi:hypothetical protein ACA910_010547 [Epithemia clementina (nom. ined.)]
MQGNRIGFLLACILLSQKFAAPCPEHQLISQIICSSWHTGGVSPLSTSNENELATPFVSSPTRPIPFFWVGTARSGEIRKEQTAPSYSSLFWFGTTGSLLWNIHLQ